jgi:hypothetical protein
VTILRIELGSDLLGQDPLECQQREALADLQGKLPGDQVTGLVKNVHLVGDHLVPARGLRNQQRVGLEIDAALLRTHLPGRGIESIVVPNPKPVSRDQLMDDSVRCEPSSRRTTRGGSSRRTGARRAPVQGL